MAFEKHLNFQGVLDGLGQGILIFDKDDNLVLDNLAAQNILGADLKLIRANGWSAASILFNTRLSDPDEQADAVRKRAIDSARPVRFHIYRSGEYMPCWVSAVLGNNGQMYTMVSIESPDWKVMSDLLTWFRDEVHSAATSTQGHTELISSSLKSHKPGDTVEHVSRRVGGFNQLISTHMHRLDRLMDMLERLEMIRMGKLNDDVRAERRKINLADFMEDFMEELDEVKLIDPETETQDYRSRLTMTVPDGLAVSASPLRLTSILHDLLRNAIMYSMKATPIIVMAHASPQNQSVQIDVIDEGYGVRGKEFERVFALLQRARQPQIIGEFGYGLSLYLCKHEVEAMGGKIWFESEEGVGSTFSFKLPLWQDDSSSRSGSKST